MSVNLLNFLGKNNKLNKKGSLQTVVLGLFFVLLLFIVGMTVISVSKFNSVITPQLKTQFTSSASQTILDNNLANYPIWMDRVIVMVFIGYWGVCLLSAFVFPEHPIIALFLIVFVVILAGVGAYFSNIWDDFAGNADNANIRSSYPKTDFLLSHFVEELLIIGFSSSYVYFLSNKRGSGF